MQRYMLCKFIQGQLIYQANELWSLILHIRTKANIMLRSCQENKLTKLVNISHHRLTILRLCGAL